MCTELSNYGPVAHWLQSFACEHYAHILESYGYDTLQKVCQLNAQYLMHMGVPQLDCERIIQNLSILKSSITQG